MTTAQRLYQRLVRAERSDQEPVEQRATARNGLRHVTANTLQAIGDQAVNARTVLPWLLASLAAPSGLIGLLVPVRESLSMLPQAALAPWVQRRAARRWVWVHGAAGQAAATAGMALAAAALEGWAAGVTILVLLAVFSLARSLNSLAGKDVLGRTVPKGERGQITGLSTLFSGAVAVTVGLGIRLLGGDEVSTGFLAVLLGAAATAWVAALVVYVGIDEPATEPADPREQDSWLRASWRLLRGDAPFRRFVLARALLLVSALSPPFIVALAAREGGLGLSGLGPFVIAQGVASLVGGRAFGRMADRSSRRLMVVGAGFASVLVLGFLALYAVPAARGFALLYPATYLLLALTHTGVRVARKTYVVDMAEDDRRTEYVAVSNSAMGVLLLVAGAVSSGLAVLGDTWALGFLALLGLLGVLVARSLPEVSKT